MAAILLFFDFLLTCLIKKLWFELLVSLCVGPFRSVCEIKKVGLCFDDFPENLFSFCELVS